MNSCQGARFIRTNTLAGLLLTTFTFIGIFEPFQTSKQTSLVFVRLHFFNFYFPSMQLAPDLG